MKKVIAYAHTHWDREWYREFEEFRLRLIEVVDEVIEELESGTLSSFYFDGQTSAMEDYLKIYPQKHEKLKALIKSKKISVGPFFCSTDQLLTNAESLIRNLLFGIQKSKEFGCEEFIAYFSDTFGHSKDTPDILDSFGIDKAILWRGLGNLPSDFLWKDVKTTYLQEGYFHDILVQNISYEKKAQYLEKFLDRIAKKSAEFILLPLGADHLAIAPNINAQLAEINKLLKNYEIELSSPFEYIQKSDKNYKKVVRKELLDNSRNFVLKGVYSSRIDLKQENMRLQWLLNRITEPMQAVFANLNQLKNRQSEIDYAYKLLIKNQAHDSIYGCSIDSVHSEMKTRSSKIDQVQNGILKRVLRDLNNDTDNLQTVNLSNFNYSGAVSVLSEKKLNKKYNAQIVSKKQGFTDAKLFDHHQIPITEDITTIYEYLVDVENLKPFSITNIKNHLSQKLTLKCSDKGLENDFISLKIEKDNSITITDKKQNKKYSDFIKIQDLADIGDSYNFGALENDVPIFALLKKTKIIEAGHIRNTLRLFFEIDIPKTSNKNGRNKSTIKHKLNIDAILYNRSEQLEFCVEWENKSKNHLLQFAFRLPEPIKKTYSEDLLSIIERDFDPNYNIYDHLPAPRGIELKTNTMPMQRFVSAQEFSLLTKGLNEYEVFQNSLKLTILRATGIISNPKNPTRGTPAGPPLETPDLQSLGKNIADFAICFVKDPNELFRLNEGFYNPVITTFSELEEKSFIEINNENILVSAIKSSVNNSTVIRFFNSSNKKQSFDFKTNLNYKKIYLSSPLEKEVSILKRPLNLKPQEIVTIKLT